MPSFTPPADAGPPRRGRRRRWLLVPLGIVAVLAILVAVFGPRWRESTNRGGQLPAEPFRIAGNFHFVGANDVSAFLITGPAGHVLIDGGYPGTAPMIVASIAKLGFDVRDVKVLLNTDPHFDHAGGLAALQAASGAALLASAPSAVSIAAGGYDREIPMPLRALSWANRYPAPRIDGRLADGDTIRVGPIAIAAHVTGGHTRGCTSYSLRVREGDRTLQVVSACSLRMLQATGYPGHRADFERAFRVLRGLRADVWVTSHGRLWGRYRKFAARDTAASPIEPFIDPEGYRAYVDSGEARFRRGVVH